MAKPILLISLEAEVSDEDVTELRKGGWLPLPVQCSARCSTDETKEVIHCLARVAS